MRYQAYAFVVTPDYRYWNPIEGTESDTIEGARALGTAYAERTFAGAPFAKDFRLNRFLREMDVRPVPSYKES